MSFVFGVIKAVPFTCLLLLFLFAVYRMRGNATRASKERERSFWEKEQEANSVRKKDISHLPYIKVPADILALDASLSPFAEKTILNLNGQTNTDLKLSYGAANLTTLSDADNNYTELIAALTRLGEQLYEEGNLNDAEKVLSYSIDIGSDVAASYTLLRNIYQETFPLADATAKIEILKTKALALNSIRREAILEKLEP